MLICCTCQVGGSPPVLAISIAQSSRHRISGAPLQMARDNIHDDWMSPIISLYSPINYLEQLTSGIAELNDLPHHNSEPHLSYSSREATLANNMQQYLKGYRSQYFPQPEFYISLHIDSLWSIVFNFAHDPKSTEHYDHQVALT